jgi:hypothetical protein
MIGTKHNNNNNSIYVLQTCDSELKMFTSTVKNYEHQNNDLQSVSHNRKASDSPVTVLHSDNVFVYYLKIHLYKIMHLYISKCFTVKHLYMYQEKL